MPIQPVEGASISLRTDTIIPVLSLSLGTDVGGIGVGGAGDLWPPKFPKGGLGDFQANQFIQSSDTTIAACKSSFYLISQLKAHQFRYAQIPLFQYSLYL